MPLKRMKMLYVSVRSGWLVKSKSILPLKGVLYSVSSWDKLETTPKSFDEYISTAWKTTQQQREWFSKALCWVKEASLQKIHIIIQFMGHCGKDQTTEMEYRSILARGIRDRWRVWLQMGTMRKFYRSDRIISNPNCDGSDYRNLYML